MTPTLTDLANAYGTDKGTLTAQGHGYTVLYDALFAPLRESVTALCEIGLSRGGPEVADGSAQRSVKSVPSVRMWHEYFPHARIVGVDISDCSAFANDWFSFVQADCGSADELARVAELGVRFDIVVDDGSHAAFHQQQTFLELFPLVKPGGLFVIEDLDWQPETYSNKLPAVPRTDILLERFIRTGQFGETGALAAERWRGVVDSIESVLTFDEEWFGIHRRLANARAGRPPEAWKRVDLVDNGTRSLKQLGAALFRRVRAELTGRETEQRYPKMQLAIIRKRAEG